MKNLFPPIRKDVLDYFEKYDIAWWKQYEDLYFPTGQLLSSQIHCLNHLFWIRKDHEAILKLIQPIGEIAGVHFEEVLHSFIDNNEAYFDSSSSTSTSTPLPVRSQAMSSLRASLLEVMLRTPPEVATPGARPEVALSKAQAQNRLETNF